MAGPTPTAGVVAVAECVLKPRKNEKITPAAAGAAAVVNVVMWCLICLDHLVPVLVESHESREYSGASFH